MSWIFQLFQRYKVYASSGNEDCKRHYTLSLTCCEPTIGKKADVKCLADEKQRTRVIAWDQYFMGVALISAQRSKDPNTQVGACIVNPTKRIVGVGYNGMPDKGIKDNDDKFPWGKESDYQKDKLLYVCHAEMNAIINKMGADIQGCTLYTTLYPCNECSKLMIQSGIRKVVYLESKDPEKSTYAASRLLLQRANIKIKKYQPKGNTKGLLEALEKL
ncbi:hypothetical protein ACJMK2_039430 [Sinanodonta woodiana]|uniref:dCMP deaminase n=1 Tax=Sinanodonta woodiana TaxID=1069815 RepID=A0ABD3WFE2_SINWO